jgi:hypothetical protein
MKNNLAMPFSESGITINFPNHDFFCFENCEGYQRLSGYHLKEMDLGWIDRSSGVVYLVELKDFTLANFRETDGSVNIDSRVWDLVKKSVDTCTLLASTIFGNAAGLEIKNCFPKPDFTLNLSDVVLIHILNSTAEQKADLQLVRDSFNQKFKAYKELFGLKQVSVLTYDQAKKYLYWVQ